MDDTRRKLFPPDTPDAHLIPKITPQDVNIAMKSLDFASSRSPSHGVPGIVLDKKEDPVEQAFFKQIQVVQILQKLGVNVDSMIDHMEIEWGIDYVQRLVKELALGPLEDVLNGSACSRFSPELLRNCVTSKVVTASRSPYRLTHARTFQEMVESRQALKVIARNENNI